MQPPWKSGSLEPCPMEEAAARGKGRGSPQGPGVTAVSPTSPGPRPGGQPPRVPPSTPSGSPSSSPPELARRLGLGSCRLRTRRPWKATEWLRHPGGTRGQLLSRGHRAMSRLGQQHPPPGAPSQGGGLGPPMAPSRHGAEDGFPRGVGSQGSPAPRWLCSRTGTSLAPRAAAQQLQPRAGELLGQSPGRGGSSRADFCGAPRARLCSGRAPHTGAGRERLQQLQLKGVNICPGVCAVCKHSPGSCQSGLNPALH